MITKERGGLCLRLIQRLCEIEIVMRNSMEFASNSLAIVMKGKKEKRKALFSIDGAVVAVDGGGAGLDDSGDMVVMVFVGERK